MSVRFIVAKSIITLHCAFTFNLSVPSMKIAQIEMFLSTIKTGSIAEAARRHGKVERLLAHR